VITDLPVGSYKVTAALVTVDSTSYGPIVTGSPANVTADTTSSVSVVYGALRTITGKIINGAGQPITPGNIGSATLNIKLLGATSNAVIDSNGGFTLADVPATYSLVLSVSASSSRLITVFQGLTRANPTLTVSQGLVPSPVQGSNAPLEGKITGGSGFPTPSNTSTVLTVAVPKAVSSFSSYFSPVNASTGVYSTFLSWLGSNPVTATVHALQFSTDTGGKITAYGGYGQQAVTVTPQGPIDPGQPIPTPVKQNVALAAVSAGSVKGAITWPPGLNTPEYQVSTNLLFAGPDQTSLNLSSPTGFGQPSVIGTPSSYDQLVPLITGAKFIQRLSINEKVTPGSFAQGATSSVWKSVTPDVNTDIVVPAPIGLKLPEENATDVNTSTKFSWSAYSGGIHIVVFYLFPSAGIVQTQVQVITAESSTTIPDLGDVIPKGVFVLWAVQGIAPYSSMDAATDTAGLILPFSSTPLVDTEVSNSASRTFKTAVK
jgi:hypothetical protein